jgi:hypothetical protein
MGPEFLLALTIGEWQSARESVAHLNRLRGDDKWTLKHAFFADMGGFMLRTSDDVQFFLDTKHLHWMLENKVIPMAEFEHRFLLDPKAIDDRNKSDIFIRVIAVGQALWFCVSIIARGVQQLPVTTLEITAIGIIVDSILVYYFWKDKPADVESTEVVDIGMTLKDMIMFEKDEDARSKPYCRTPLDFTSRESWAMGIWYDYWMYLLRRLGARLRMGRIQRNSFGRRSENDALPLKGIGMIIVLIASFVFLATNFIAWDFHFPTPTERWLWRAASCGPVALGVAGLPFLFYYNLDRVATMQQEIRQRRRILESTAAPNAKANRMGYTLFHLRRYAMRVRNSSSAKDPNLDVALLPLIIATLLFFPYILARGYILVEDVIAFRALPAAAYITVDWGTYLPHVN